MPSQSSGPLTAFFMFVPLVAVPALAIFGVPEFKQVTSLIENADSRPSLGKVGDAEQLLDQSTDDLVSPVRNDITRLEGKGSYETSAHEPANAGHDGLQNALNGRSRASSNQGMLDSDGTDSENWSPPPHVLNEWDPSPNEGKQASASTDTNSGESASFDFDKEKTVSVAATDDDDSPFKPLEEFAGDDSSEGGAPPKSADRPNRNQHKDSATDESAVADSKATNPFEAQDRSRTRQNPQADAPTGKSGVSDDSLTWKSAVKRLQALGISNYQLQPGDKANEFHFSCSYAAPNQPRVTRRFEAEAAEPLQAVRQVIAQVESMSGK